MYKIGISMLFFWNKTLVSVSVCYSILKIGIGKVKIFKIGKNRFMVNRSIPTICMCWWHLSTLSAPAENAIRVPNMLSRNLLLKEKHYLLNNSVIGSWVDFGSTPTKIKQGAKLGQVQPKLSIVLTCFRNPR